MKPTHLFPKSFLWGCATASYQVEGAAREGGRGPSIWDTFSHAPGRTAADHTGDVGCDQYHLFKKDVALMRWMGVRAYRFSISWSRVFPDGTGRVNRRGVAYYQRLIDALLDAGIEPWVTFFHWDLPQALEDRWGGWRSRETAAAFADYAGHMTGVLSDRVTRFFTINEFVCFTDFGYAGVTFPPGLQLPDRERNQVRHHALLAHGLAVGAIRANARRRPWVGLAENTRASVPVIETPEHIAAARTALRHLNGPFLTTVLEGRYPDFYLEQEGANAPRFTDADLRAIGAPLDFVGLNLYTPTYVRAAPETKAGFVEVPKPAAYPHMDMPWLAYGPQVLYWGPRLVRDIWRVPRMVISENGTACQDRLAPDSQVYDTDRVMFLREHLASLHRAVAEGVPVLGYFHWSLLDNFEWACGYTKRFGLVYVNFETRARTPKLSAEFYRQTIARRGPA